MSRADIQTYKISGKFIARSGYSLGRFLYDDGARYYVYVLCYPTDSDDARPFYIGVGAGNRVFEHEYQAEWDPNSSTGREHPKSNVINTIRVFGEEVLRVIDSVSDSKPWARETELIDYYGLISDGTGILTNRVRGRFSTRDELPSNFRLADVALKVTWRPPWSYFGTAAKILDKVEQHAGITGRELVELLRDVSFPECTLKRGLTRLWIAREVDKAFENMEEPTSVITDWRRVNLYESET